MSCAHCQSDDVDESGICRVCGFRPEDPSPPEADHRDDRKPYEGAFEMDYSDKNGGAAQELPEWRKELSRRLQEIKQKRDERSGEPASPAAAMAVVDASRIQSVGQRQASVASITTEVKAPDAPPSATDSTSQQSKPARRPPIPPKRAAAPRVSRTSPEAREPGLGAMPLFRKPPETKPTPPRPEELKDAIDRAVGRQVTTSDAAPPELQLAAAVRSTLPAPAGRNPVMGPSGPDRLILLTRTLSGLVDLIIVAACTLGVIAAADFVAGVGDVDGRSLMLYSALLLLVFLLYSVYFLGTASQTIGMMITDLRILGDDQRRPGFRKIVARSIAYLVSFLPAGIGLLWGCFDGECRCWHDRMSGTRVVRLS